MVEELKEETMHCNGETFPVNAPILSTLPKAGVASLPYPAERFVSSILKLDLRPESEGKP